MSEVVIVLVSERGLYDCLKVLVCLFGDLKRWFRY